MPTSRPRLTITLTEPTARALSAAARCMKRSRGSIVLGLVDQAAPMLEQLAVAAQALERASPKERAAALARAPHFLATIEALGRTAEATSASVASTLDLFAAVPPAGAAARPSEARSRTPSAASRPPSVNKGGEPPRGGGSKVTKMGGRGVRK